LEYYILHKQGNFSVLDELVGKAEVATTFLAMKDVCQEEIDQTINFHERGDWAG
jgi:hypothetical protein